MAALKEKLKKSRLPMLEKRRMKSAGDVDADIAGTEWSENGYSALFTTQELLCTRAQSKEMAGKFISGCCETSSLNGLNRVR